MVVTPQFEVTCSAGTITYKAAPDGAGNAVALVQSTGLPAGNLALFLARSCHSFASSLSAVPPLSCHAHGRKSVHAGLSGEAGQCLRRHETTAAAGCLGECSRVTALRCMLRRTTGVTTSFLERVVVYGVAKSPAAVKATPTGGSAVDLEFAYDKDAQVSLLCVWRGTFPSWRRGRCDVLADAARGMAGAHGTQAVHGDGQGVVPYISLGRKARKRFGPATRGKGRVNVDGCRLGLLRWTLRRAASKGSDPVAAGATSTSAARHRSPLRHSGSPRRARGATATRGLRRRREIINCNKLRAQTAPAPARARRGLCAGLCE